MSVDGRLEELQAAVGHVGESPRHDQPGGDALAAVAHRHVDRDEFLAGQGLLGLLQQLRARPSPKRSSMLFLVNFATRDMGSESA